MFRTKTELLRDLDPHNPASIQALIDFHRTAFGGFVMKDDDADADTDAKSGDGKDGDQTDASKDGAGKDEPLGEGGKKALQRERDARKKLEKDISDMKANQASQARKLAEALGVETKDAKSSDEITETLQNDVAEMRHQLLVERVARAYKITDDDDLELLRAAGNEDSMRKLATRLAGTAKTDADDGDGKGGEGKGGDGKGRKPRPDPSQGKGGSGGKPSSVAQVMADRAAARAAKNN